MKSCPAAVARLQICTCTCTNRQSDCCLWPRSLCSFSSAKQKGIFIQVRKRKQNLFTTILRALSGWLGGKSWCAMSRIAYVHSACFIKSGWWTLHQIFCSIWVCANRPTGRLVLFLLSLLSLLLLVQRQWLRTQHLHRHGCRAWLHEKWWDKPHHVCRCVWGIWDKWHVSAHARIHTQGHVTTGVMTKWLTVRVVPHTDAATQLLVRRHNVQLTFSSGHMNLMDIDLLSKIKKKCLLTFSLSTTLAVRTASKLNHAKSLRPK